MNNTVLNIDGIKVLHEIIDMQDSTDTTNTIVIKDDHGNEVRITIQFGKITNVYEKVHRSK